MESAEGPSNGGVDGQQRFRVDQNGAIGSRVCANRVLYLQVGLALLALIQLSKSCFGGNHRTTGQFPASFLRPSQRGVM